MAPRDGPAPPSFDNGVSVLGVGAGPLGEPPSDGALVDVVP